MNKDYLTDLEKYIIIILQQQVKASSFRIRRDIKLRLNREVKLDKFHTILDKMVKLGYIRYELIWIGADRNVKVYSATVEGSRMLDSSLADLAIMLKNNA